jgi:hypothetical protein
MLTYFFQYGLADLEALALSHLKKQLTVKNVIHECFSRFSAVNSPVMDTQLSFIRDLEGTQEQQASMKKDIGAEISTGIKEHHAKVLVAIFDMFMKQTYVPLPCSRSSSRPCSPL